MKNQDAIDKLRVYFLQQDPKDISRLTANLIIDIQRFLNLHTLQDEEVKSLFARSHINIMEVEDFLRNGPSKEFKLISTIEL